MNTNTYINNLINHISNKYQYDFNQLCQCIEFDGWQAEVKLNLKNFDDYIDSDFRNITGSFYTPKALAQGITRLAFRDYFVNNNLLNENDAEALFLKDKKLNTNEFILEHLISLKIADISCGAGIFLQEAFLLIKNWYSIHNRTIDIQALIANLYGFDINKETLQVASLWFLDQLLMQGYPVQELNLFHQDTLLSNESYDFDLIIGNPPYVGEKGNKDLFDAYRHLEGYEGKMDLFYFFIYKGMTWLKKTGVLSFITTNYWITADGAKKLRNFIKNKTGLLRLINLDEVKLFKSAKGMHNLIFSLSHSKDGACQVQILKDGMSLEDLYKTQYSVNQSLLYSETGNIVLYEEAGYFDIIKHMIQQSPYQLKHLVQINQGIVSGADKVTQRMLDKKIDSAIIKKYAIEKDQGIFASSEAISDISKPFYKNSHIKHYFINQKTEQYILYITDDTPVDDVVINYLKPFKSVLEARREVKNKARKWYALQWYRDPHIFENEKLVVPQRSIMNTFAYHKGSFYASADVYFITKGPLKLLTGYLNSKTVHFWLYNRGKRKGQYLELYAKPLSLIPVPYFDVQTVEMIEALVSDILLDGYTEEKQRKIDDLIYKAFEFSKEQILQIERLYKKRGLNA